MALRILLRLSVQKQKHRKQFMGWCIFVATLGRCLAFLGVSYFGQIGMLRYLMLSIVGFVAEENEKAGAETFNLRLRSHELSVILDDRWSSTNT